jgi:hypothetical protein
MSRGILLLVILCTSTIVNSQSITPFTVNIAGFTATQSGYSLTVSTGETISITNFKAPNGESLNSGFLQNNPPLVTGIDESNEVTVTPNPTNSITHLITNFSVPGQMQYQILDITSKLLFRSQPVNGINNKQTKIELSNYPAGTYYILVFYKPITGNSKTGIYKIVKL